MDSDVIAIEGGTSRSGGRYRRHRLSRQSRPSMETSRSSIDTTWMTRSRPAVGRASSPSFGPPVCARPPDPRLGWPWSLPNRRTSVDAVLAEEVRVELTEDAVGRPPPDL